MSSSRAPGDLQVHLLRDALVRERVEHLVPQLARARLDQRVGDVDRRAGHGGVEHRLAELGLDTALLALGEPLADVVAQLVERVEAGLGGEVVVELGQLLRLDLLDRDGELGLLAGQLLGAVVVGERDVDGALVAGGRARELLLEAGDEPAGAELDHLVAALAAGERRRRRACPGSPSPRSRPRRPRARRSRAGRSARAGARPRRRPPRRRRPGSRLPTSRPLYSPSVAVGRTPISIENVSGWPWPGSSPMSSCGSPTGTIAAASIAAEYQAPIESRTASSSTASRPMRLITTGAGALPARKPGTRMLRPSARAATAMRFSTSSGGTSASTRTRDSGSSVTDVEMGGAAMGGDHDTVAPCSSGSRRGSSPARPATCGPGWPTGSCCWPSRREPGAAPQPTMKPVLPTAARTCLFVSGLSNAAGAGGAPLMSRIQLGVARLDRVDRERRLEHRVLLDPAGLAGVGHDAGVLEHLGGRREPRGVLRRALEVELRLLDGLAAERRLERRARARARGRRRPRANSRSSPDSAPDRFACA